MKQNLTIEQSAELIRKGVPEYKASETLDDIIGIFAKWMAHSDQRNDFVVLNWY